jgi:2-desacetyl-2-hydroxyethyl bacteriochlorophyllide A dehydrogenase
MNRHLEALLCQQVADAFNLTRAHTQIQIVRENPDAATQAFALQTARIGIGFEAHFVRHLQDGRFRFVGDAAIAGQSRRNRRFGDPNGKSDIVKSNDRPGHNSFAGTFQQSYYTHPAIVLNIVWKSSFCLCARSNVCSMPGTVEFDRTWHRRKFMTATMKGAILPGNSTVEFRTVEIPEPGYGQVLVRMKASSICGSDLRAIYRAHLGKGAEGYTPGTIAGHEPCGQIEKVGPGCQRFKVGDRVVIYHISGCGVCHDCRRGYMISCHGAARAAHGWQRDGGHAPFMLAEERTLVALPDELSYIDGAMVACGFGTAYAACRRAEVSGRDNVLITGLGPVGLGAALLCRALGARVVGVEAVLERRALAAQLGFTEVVAPDENALEGLMALSDGHGFEVALDCSGVGAARHLCLEAARDWGRMVFIGEGGEVSFAPSPLVIHKQLTLHGSWVCSIGQMEELVELLVRWNLHPEDIVTHRFTLEQTHEAYQTFDSGKTGKVVIVWD